MKRINISYSNIYYAIYNEYQKKLYLLHIRCFTSVIIWLLLPEKLLFRLLNVISKYLRELNLPKIRFSMI